VDDDSNAYNSLHLSGKKAMDQHGQGAQASGKERGEGVMYSHLLSGEECAYNQVDRERRVRVVDGEYAHLSK
jgi:hypothetical protein